ncbi:hypothetical protein OG394_31180 [Kribbella sp. NBC_01245]|uniref:hypothetical protein n=1 Tax=Kribbella sp. NBC_01245 TaxID=2903578 RepID=UPI002E27D581|nr:hypothetical protein [Kribbella sp. NBC_01245]
MTEKAEVQTLFAELTDHDPLLDIDVDAQITRGKRRVHRRTAALVTAALAVPALAIGGVQTLRQTDTPVAVAELPGVHIDTPTLPPTVPELMEGPDGPGTAKTRALMAELIRLTPEYAEDLRKTGYEQSWSLGDPGWRPTRHLSVGTQVDGKQVHPELKVSVAHRPSGSRAQPICDSLAAPNKCSDIRRLPDGAIAFLDVDVNTLVQKVTTIGTRLVHPDGFEVSVSSMSIGDTPNPLTLARTLEIARGIATTP